MSGSVPPPPGAARQVELVGATCHQLHREPVLIARGPDGARGRASDRNPAGSGVVVGAGPCRPPRRSPAQAWVPGWARAPPGCRCGTSASARSIRVWPSAVVVRPLGASGPVTEPQSGRLRSPRSLSAISRNPSGMHPVNWLEPSRRNVRLDRRPSSVGIPPVNRLEPSRRYHRFDRRPSSGWNLTRQLVVVEP